MAPTTINIYTEGQGHTGNPITEVLLRDILASLRNLHTKVS